MHPDIRWGILGPGSIAHKFAQAFAFVPNGRIIAVGSRNLSRARQFANRYHIPRFYGSYEDMLTNASIDVVYIATPHGRHYEDIRMCLNHNKAVLCEKSFTLNAQQAREVCRLAENKQLFLMEAMWTRFLPVMQLLKQKFNKGDIGHLQLLSADLGFRFPFNAQNRLFNLKLGGGALLDIGVYPVSLSYWLLGKPQHIASQAVLGISGVDEQAGMVFKYAKGTLAHLLVSLRSATPSQGILAGDTGMMILKAPLYCPEGILWIDNNGNKEYIKAELEGNGFNYEIIEVNRCLLRGYLQSEIMPWKDTIEIMEIMDGLRKQWGLRYPQESGWA